MILREALIHAQLVHPNILPFLGIHKGPSARDISIIVPLARHGDAGDYLANLEESERAHALPRIVCITSTCIYYSPSSDYHAWHSSSVQLKALHTCMANHHL